MAEIKAPTGTGCSSRVFCSQKRVKATSCPAWPCPSLTVPQQPFRFSVQLLTRLPGLDQGAKSGLGTGCSPTGCCARVLLLLLPPAVTPWLLAAPRASKRSLMLLSAPSRARPPLPLPRRILDSP